jgi:DNA-binding winged helix-turn-helix (wHTH) protein
MSPSVTHRYRFDDVQIDLASFRVLKAGKVVQVEPKALNLLVFLVENRGRLVEKRELLDTVWKDASVTENVLTHAIAQLRKGLADDAKEPRYIETVHTRGYRFIADVDAEVPATTRPEVTANLSVRGQVGMLWKVIVPAALVVATLAAAGYFYFHRGPKLTDKDTIVLADFTNATRDPVFDGTLRQALSVQLEQSPFLSLISDERIQQTLRLMGQPLDARLTPDIARQLCQRTESAVVVDGSIANLGTQYVVGLKAVRCGSGDSLAEEQVTADGKEQVMKALSEAATTLRTKLGESLITVEKFSTPVAQVTTPSLEALQAYGLGRSRIYNGEYSEAVPFLQRAIQLDPNFAMAYALLGLAVRNPEERLKNMRKAYELREGVSERERFGIEAQYQRLDTGNLDKERQVYELWMQVYPRDETPHGNLSAIYSSLGQHDKALAEGLESLRRLPGNCPGHAFIVLYYLELNRLEEARVAAEEARAKKLDCPALRFFLYKLAFFQKDAAGMAQQVELAAGKPGPGSTMLLISEADTAAYSGRLRQAREFSRHAIAKAEPAERTETASSDESRAATREALFGNAAEARQRAAAALALSTGRDAQYRAALALALIGEVGRAQTLADDLGKRFPEDTFVQFSYLPTLHAQIALSRNDASGAIEALQAAGPYELGDMSGNNPLYSIYVRGEAYLATNQANEAAAEFQKIIDHRGIVLNDPIGALAHLQIARAYAMQGDTAKAKEAYQDFLTLWKDADPEIPILIAAKAEYAKGF